MEQYCRLCLNEDAILTSVFQSRGGQEIARMVRRICSISIEENDTNSKQICLNCADIVSRAHELRLMSIKNNADLKKRIALKRHMTKVQSNAKLKPNAPMKFRADSSDSDVVEVPMEHRSTQKGSQHSNSTLTTNDQSSESKRRRIESESLVCHFCGKIAKHKYVLELHIRRHLADIQCPKCPRKFRSVKELKTHSIVHSNVRNFICEICSKGFKCKYSLTTHKKTHLAKDDTKLLECPQCHIKLKKNLNVHMLIHTGICKGFVLITK